MSIALALLFGAKAFAQEWEYSHSYIKDTVLYQYHNTYEIPLTHNIVVKEIVEPWTSISTRVGLSLFSPEGELLTRIEHYKPAFWSGDMLFLQNNEGELFALSTYSPDHDYRSPNYFMNFDSVPDYAILGLYKLDDSLRVVESMEHRFTVDTFEMRGNEWWELSKNWRSGYIHPFSVFVDDDGYIVGNYVKAISFGHEDIAKDTMVFFRMDFDGNFVTKVDYPCLSTGGDVIPFCWAAQSGNIMKINDSTYVMYDLSGSIFGGTTSNVIYLDRDFNVTLVRRISHIGATDNYSYIYPSVLRSPHCTTYVSTTVSDEAKNTYDIHLYEYNDTDGLWGYMHPVRHIKRFYDWDHTARFRGMALGKGGDIYFAYTLNLGYCDCLDSWMMIERLDENMDTISTLYYDIKGADIHSEAFDILSLSDGGILLTSNSKDMNETRHRWNTVTKFPAEAFVGIEEAHNNGLKVAVAYPNPGTSELNIRTALRNARVEVYDAAGRKIHSHEITEEVTPIGTEAWPSGMYVWKVIANGKEAESGKWVKE